MAIPWRCDVRLPRPRQEVSESLSDKLVIVEFDNLGNAHVIPDVVPLLGGGGELHLPLWR